MDMMLNADMLIVFLVIISSQILLVTSDMLEANCPINNTGGNDKSITF